MCSPCSCRINLLIREKLIPEPVQQKFLIPKPIEQICSTVNLLNGRDLLTLVPAEQINQSCLTNLYCRVLQLATIRKPPSRDFIGRRPLFLSRLYRQQPPLPSTSTHSRYFLLFYLFFSLSSLYVPKENLPV